MVNHGILTTYGIYHSQLTVIFFLQKKKKTNHDILTQLMALSSLSRLLVSFGIKIWKSRDFFFFFLKQKSRDFKIVGFFYIFLHIAQVFVSSINKWNPFLLILTIFQFWLSTFLLKIFFLWLSMISISHSTFFNSKKGCYEVIYRLFNFY